MSPPEAAPPRFLKGGLVLVDPVSRAVTRVVVLQYNPESISRILQPELTGRNTTGSRAEPLKFTGPPIETIQVEMRFDAAEQLDPAGTTAGARPARTTSPSIAPGTACLGSTPRWATVPSSGGSPRWMAPCTSRDSARSAAPPRSSSPTRNMPAFMLTSRWSTTTTGMPTADDALTGPGRAWPPDPSTL